MGKEITFMWLYRYYFYRVYRTYEYLDHKDPSLYAECLIALIFSLIPLKIFIGITWNSTLSNFVQNIFIFVPYFALMIFNHIYFNKKGRVTQILDEFKAESKRANIISRIISGAFSAGVVSYFILSLMLKGQHFIGF